MVPQVMGPSLSNARVLHVTMREKYRILKHIDPSQCQGSRKHLPGFMQIEDLQLGACIPEQNT